MTHYHKDQKVILNLSFPRSSIDDLVFLVLPSIFFKLSYKISLIKNGFGTYFSTHFQKITPNFSCIGRCKICASLGFAYPKRAKKTKSPVADEKNCKFSAKANYL